MNNYIFLFLRIIIKPHLELLISPHVISCIFMHNPKTKIHNIKYNYNLKIKYGNNIWTHIN